MPRHASASTNKAKLPSGSTTFVAAVFQKSSTAPSPFPRPAADSVVSSHVPPTEAEDRFALNQSGESTPRSSASSVGRIPSIDRNIFNVEAAVGGSLDRPKTNMIIKGTFKELLELREKIRAEFRIASIDEVGDIEIFDEENNSWKHLVSFELADRLSRKSIAKLRWYPPNIDKLSSRAHKVQPAMCPPGDSAAYSFRPAAVTTTGNFRAAAVPSVSGVAMQQQHQQTSPKLSARTPSAALSLNPIPPMFSLRALPRSSASPTPPLIFCVRGGPVPSASPSIDASSARALVTPDVAPMLFENCDCTGMFVMETSGSPCTVRLAVSIICSGWFIPASPQQNALRITAGDVFHMSSKNVPFRLVLSASGSAFVFNFDLTS